MKCRSVFAFVLFAALLVALSEAHICLINPVQRAGYNVSGPGMMACFRPDGPCGKGIPAEQPRVTLTGGRGFSVLLQQNLNHYNPGHAGFIDVAYAQGPNPQSSDFIPLATVPDFWPWMQASQTNFSIPVSVPNIDCPHCVIRVRYHPNKPTEPVFHNCADVAITRGSSSPKSFGSLFGLVRYERVPFAPTETLSLISDDGSLAPLQANIGVRSVGSGSQEDKANINQYYLAEGLATINKAQQLIHFVGYSDIVDYFNNTVPSTLITYSYTQQRFLDSIAIERPTGEYASHWVSILSISDDSKNKILVELVGPNSQGAWRYQYRILSPNGAVSSVQATFPFDDTFVNFFWADYDQVNQKLYILSGDENSLFTLRVKLFVADLKAKTVSNVMVDNSRYTLTNVHVHPSGGIVALSPGLFNGNVERATWSLVKIDPSSGQVSPIGLTAPLGQYQAWYGGGVYGAAISDGVVVHAFKKVIDGSIVVAGIDVDSGRVVGTTDLQNGVNGDLSLFGLIHLPFA